MPGKIGSCPIEKTGYEMIDRFSIPYSDGGEIIVVASEELLSTMPSEIHAGWCKDDKTGQLYYKESFSDKIQAEMAKRYKSILTGVTSTDSSESLQIIPDKYFNIKTTVPDNILENGPKKMDPANGVDNWAMLDIPVDEKTIAQIRFVMNDTDNKIFRRSEWEPHSYYIIRDETILQKTIDILYEAKNAIKTDDPENQELIKYVSELTFEFRVAKERMYQRGESFGDLVVLCLVGFGILSPLGNELVRLLFHGSKKLSDWIKKNGKGPKDPGGGAPSEDIAAKPVKSGDPVADNISLNAINYDGVKAAKNIWENFFDGTSLEGPARIFFENQYNNWSQTAKRLRNVKDALDNGLQIERDDWQLFENFLNGYIKDPLIADNERTAWIDKYSYEAGPENCDIRVLSRPEDLGSWEQSISPATAIGIFGSTLLGAHFLTALTVPSVSELLAPAAAGL